jgi:hypothetical protein
LPATTFERALLRSATAGQLSNASSLDWYRTNITRIRTTPQAIMQENRDNMTLQPLNGKMYLFEYEPKGKKTLKYYDTFPLIFKIQMWPEGFLGMNFHYLNYKQRAQLMNALYDLASDKEINEETRLLMTYKLLQNSTKFRWFKPTLKKYSKSNIRSRFLEIMPEQWNAAIMLPIARFKKEKNSKVWRDSENVIQHK